MKLYQLFICVLFSTIYSQSSLIAMNYNNILQNNQKNNNLTCINKSNITQSEQKANNGHYILFLLDNTNKYEYVNRIKKRIEYRESSYISFENIKNKIKQLRTKFKNDCNNLHKYYHSLLLMLHYSLVQYYEDYIISNFDKDDNNNNKKKIMDHIEKCKTITRYLILLDSEHYIYSNNVKKSNLDTMVTSNIYDNITITIYSIKEYMKFLLSLNKIESNVVDNILFRFNLILQDIINNDMEKIKQFYYKYYSVLDNSIYNGNKFSNDIDKEFDDKYDYYNWFE